MKWALAKMFRRFPFQIGLGALLFYGLTLSHGVTINSLSVTAKIAGWDWLPLANLPLLWLLTLPVRLLPVAWVPVALNLFSALCGALTLGLLARSLELLPWCRPLATLSGWRGRLPVLLAVAVCGLEFNFWQDATAVTGEMLDGLLLAAVIWCGLEYRVSKELRWLQAAAFIWGAGMAESWVMQITIPLFIAALIGLLKERFFQRQVILELAGLGLAGIALYALVPLANGLWPGSPWNLHEAWLQSFRETKALLLGIHGQFWVWHRIIALVVLLFYLLPLVALLVRFGHEDAKNKSPLDRSLIWIFRGMGVGLVLVCLWLAFDPKLGPRQIMARQINVSLPLLSFDYLNALGIGFLAGNLLLLLKPHDDEPSFFRNFGWYLVAGLERAAIPVMTGLLLLAGLGLVARNLPAITLANRHPLTQFGELALRSLPPGGGIVVSDFPEKLSVFQAAQAQHPDKSGWRAVDIKALPMPEYRSHLKRMYGGGWLATTNEDQLTSGEMLHLMDRLAQTNQIYYLHPSFGYFFELFYQQPVGLIFELTPYPTNAVNPPALSVETITQNEKFWDDTTPELESLQHFSSPAKLALFNSVKKHLGLETVMPQQVLLLQEWYSMGLDAWGVQLQRNGRLPAAQRRFTQALALNTNNWVAQLNLYCNANLQAGTNMNLAGVDNLANQLESLQKMVQFMSDLGPMDEPDCCYLLGNAYLKYGLPRLAMQQFARAHALAPDALAPELALADVYVRCRLTDQALTTINHLRGKIKQLPDDNAGLAVQLALLEAGVWLSKTNSAQAVNVLQEAVQQHPDDDQTLNQISQAYFAFGDFTNAEQLVASLLAREPDNIPALLIQSGVLLQTRRAVLAIPVLNHVLALTNSPQAKMNRALAFVQTTNYAAAQTDYLDLENNLPNPFLAEYGLAQLAELQHDTNQAVHYLKLCLAMAPPASAQWQSVHARLAALKPVPSAKN